MGLFDKLFRRPPKDRKPAETLNGWWPIFTQYGTNIYGYDVVQQALKCIVDEIKKLRPVDIRVTDGEPAPVKSSSVKDVLDMPNPLMTTADFLEKTTWLLLLNYNVFIVPTYRVWVDDKTGEERRTYEALWPINPTTVNFIEDASGRLFVNFIFTNGTETTLPYDNVIHVKYNYSVNDYMGGDLTGNPDNKGILQTVQLNQEILTGIAKAMKASYAVNGIVKYNSVLDEGKVRKAVAEMERNLRANESGILPIDLKADFTALPRNTQIVSQDTLKFLDEKILRNWGVPLCILQGDYTAAQYEAFYQKTLEPIIISLTQALTKGLFTSRERAFGRRVALYPKDLIFLSMEQTLRMIEILSPTGGLYENEKRAALGMQPLEALNGKRYMSLNWIDAANAAQYQVGKENIDVIDEEKEG